MQTLCFRARWSLSARAPLEGGKSSVAPPSMRIRCWSFRSVFVVYAGSLPGAVGRPLIWARQAAFAVLIISAINARGAAAAALNARWVRYVGRLSYSLYLWQQPLLWTKTWGQNCPWFAYWP